MASRQKEKGDREERTVLSILRENGFAYAERTKAGFERDRGDIFLDPIVGLSPGVICQVKDVKTPLWTKWIDQLEAQKDESKAEVAFLSLKRSIPGKPPLRLAVMELHDMIELLRLAGYGEELKETSED